MNIEEEKTWRGRYSYCKNIEQMDDLLLVYPDEFNKNPSEVAEDLQKSMNFLKSIADLDPTDYFRQRTIVGYRHRNDEGERNCQPGWSPNWVNIPWGYLGKQNEPQDVCSHELIHPFFRCSPLHNRNEGWGDGFCDFLRGPVKKVMGLNGDDWWQCMIKAAKGDLDSEYHYPAGQFIIKAYDKYGNSSQSINELIDNNPAIRGFVKFLFSNYVDTPISTYIRPSPKMIEKWGNKEKI